MIYLFVCAAVVVADQAFKQWIVSNVAPDTIRALIPGFISVTYVRNYGAAFSILQHMRWLFVAATVVFTVGAIWAYLKKKVTYPLGLWALTAIMAGAIGNCVDRFRFGYVVDMFNFDFINFAIFNIADCFIVGGTILFCIYLFFLYEKKEIRKLPVEPDKDEKAEH